MQLASNVKILVLYYKYLIDGAKFQLSGDDDNEPQMVNKGKRFLSGMARIRDAYTHKNG